MAKLLVLESYYDGSHRAFVDGWRARSDHEITLLTLPGHHWKWRMRHASWTFASMAAETAADGLRWDAVLACSMVNLPEFLGLLRWDLRPTAALCYFHENQLTYPDPHRDARDVHFGLSQIASAMAGASLFNSAYHRDDFFDAARKLLAGMPDCNDTVALDRAAEAARVIPPGIDSDFPDRRRPVSATEPLHIVWAARWEHDKQFELLADALDRLDARGLAFRLSVMGQSFRSVPEVFERTRRRHAERLVHFGWCDRRDYRAALAACDVLVSTAGHEFFGIAAVEAAAAGAALLLPRRLAYPEIFGRDAALAAEFFYDGSAGDLAEKLEHLAARKAAGDVGYLDRGIETARRYDWRCVARQLDEAVAEAAKS